MKSWTYTTTEQFLNSEAGWKYLARLNRQPVWVSPVHMARVEPPKTYGGFRVAKRVRNDAGRCFESMQAAARELRMSESTIRRSIAYGDMTGNGRFFRMTEEEYQAAIGRGAA